MNNDSKKLDMIRKAMELADYLDQEDPVVMDVIREILEMANGCPEDEPEEILKINPDSSWICSFDYDKDDKILTMVTRTGREYQYYDVPVDLWDDLCAVHEDGESVGTFYNEWIKGQFESQEV